jgi:hypothetical protein
LRFDRSFFTLLLLALLPLARGAGFLLLFHDSPIGAAVNGSVASGLADDTISADQLDATSGCRAGPNPISGPIIAP